MNKRRGNRRLRLSKGELNLLYFLLILLFLFFNAQAYPQKKTETVKNKVNIKLIDKEKKVTPEAKSPYEYEEPRPPEVGNTFFTFLRALLSLLIIIVLIYLSIYGLKFLYSKKTILPSSSNIRIWDTIFLASNKSLHLIEIGEEILLLGVTEQGMSLLKEIKDKETIKMIKQTGRVGTISQAMPNFAQYLSSWTNKFKGTTAGQSSEGMNIEKKIKMSQENLQGKLQKLKDLRKKIEEE